MTIEDRIAGLLVGSACGDALGAGYEFTPPEHIPEQVGMVGGGIFGWAPGEWTDDTSMAWVIAEVAASGADLRSEQAQDLIAAGWFAWLGEAKDVGAQTRAVLMAAAQDSAFRVPSAAKLRLAAEHHHQMTGRSAGNGSLMRTAPLALAYLDDPQALAEAAIQISQLTHHDPEAAEACVLHCLAIRHAVLSGEIDLAVGLDQVAHADLWRQRLDGVQGRDPRSFTNNYWAVEALMAAWAAVLQAPGIDGLEVAVRGGHDTDTVACIAGALVGAAHGLSALPQQWLAILHGWPGKRAEDLIEVAGLIAG